MDEHILAQYSKLAKRWEGKGGSIYSLSSASGLPAKALIVWGGNHLFGGMTGTSIDLSLYLWDFCYNLQGMLGNIPLEGIPERNPYLDKFIEFCKMVNRVERLPTFLFGGGFTGLSLYEIAKSMGAGEPIGNAAGWYLAFGAGLLAMATSQYLKDRNI